MLECKRILKPGMKPYPGYTYKVDVYSLGACLYWMIAGVPLFDRNLYRSDSTMAKAILDGYFKVP